MAANRRRFWCLLLVLACVFAGCGKDKEKEEPKARIRVRGLGLLQDRETRLGIERLWGDRPPPELNTSQLEDAALFIASNLADKGYLKPAIGVEAKLDDGTVERFAIDLTLEDVPPKWLRVRSAVFQVERGTHFYFEDVKIEGLQTVPPETALGFFYADVALLGSRGARSFSPSRLRRALDAIESTLKQQGYFQAEVKAAETKQDDKSGRVDVRVQVTQGPRWELADLSLDVQGQDLPELKKMKDKKGRPWTVYLQQDLAHEIRSEYYKRGYPDVRVNIEHRARPEDRGTRLVDAIAHVRSGGQVAVGAIKFEGQQRTKTQVMVRRVDLAPGEPLNPGKVDQARYRLGRLGIFKTVEAHTEPAEGPVRDVIFDLKEEKRVELHLMAGYGSYEQLRGGIELQQRNLWGRAHRSRLELVQSMKSSRGEYTYSVPELLGESIDGSVKLFGLQREERAFLRQEYGGTVTLTRPIPWLKAEGSLGYTYQALQNSENELSTREQDERAVPVASIDIGITRDARDNPLKPRHGYRWYLQSELAAKQLGGELNYQRIEFGGSYHTSWGRGRWVHAGFSHGVITTFGSTDRLLPVNKRFYPGGESSIRGYGEGEASPRGEDLRYIGAKSYTLLNLELEQALFKNWSIVAFTDALGTTAQLAKYPFDEKMVSVGLGLRYQTIIGPIRVEYGHNVLKRDNDPSGAVHVSVGFPF